jgi:hypothetical protein
MELSKKQQKIITIIIMVIISVISFIYCDIKTFQLKKVCSETATATVTNIETYHNGSKEIDCQRTDKNHKHTYKYTYSFYVNGTEYGGYADDFFLSNVSTHRINDTVTIWYNPNNPNVFMEKYNFLAYVAMLLPIIFIGVTIYTIIYMIRHGFDE